ncbi:MAG: DUF3619 family protein [Burkholderiaceae bacterium]|jgi:hypothetical protein|nr:DUF3619 family protein [Burkholderiaceae bacterium]
MNEHVHPTTSAPPDATTLRTIEALESRVGRRVVARLDEATRSLPPGVETRLAFARTQALARTRAKRRAVAAATTVVASGVAARRGRGWPAWWRLAGTWLPLVLVAAGLWAIGQWREQDRILAAAELDARLLTDVLPPAAYADPGFEAFLRQGDAR